MNFEILSQLEDGRINVRVRLDDGTSYCQLMKAPADGSADMDEHCFQFLRSMGRAPAGFFLDSSGAYYDGIKQAHAHLSVPQRPSADHVWDGAQWVFSEQKAALRQLHEIDVAAGMNRSAREHVLISMTLAARVEAALSAVTAALAAAAPLVPQLADAQAKVAALSAAYAAVADNVGIQKVTQAETLATQLRAAL
jgi:hypothetical protein